MKSETEELLIDGVLAVAGLSSSALVMSALPAALVGSTLFKTFNKIRDARDANGGGCQTFEITNQADF